MVDDDGQKVWPLDAKKSMNVCRTFLDVQGPLYRSSGMVVVVEKSLSKCCPCMRIQCAILYPKPVTVT